MAFSLPKWLLFFLLGCAVLNADPYQILGVSSGASDEEVKKAYLDKVRKEHPDISSLPKAEAERRFKEIQTAWEKIEEKRTRSTDLNRERTKARQEAKEEALRILEDAWKNGSFGPDTFSSLPRFQQLGKRSPLSPFPNRGAKENGEWEAIESFFKNHQDELVQRSPENLLEILRNLDRYSLLTADSVRSVRAGLTDKIEQAIFERTESKSVFLDALKDRLERLNRSGAFLQTTTPSVERERAFGNTPELFSKKFGSQEGTSPEMHLAKALMDRAFSEIGSNQVRVHELGSLIRSIPPALSPSEQLSFLAGFLEKLGNSSEDLRSRAERAIKNVFSKNPNLAQDVKNKTSFWSRLTGSVTSCDLILQRLVK